MQRGCCWMRGAKGMLLDERRRALGLKAGARIPPHMAFLGNLGTDRFSLYVICAGEDLTINEGNKKVTYEGDMEGDSAKYLGANYWVFTSTGDFMDEPTYQNSRFINATSVANLSDLYVTAHLSPLSMTYFHYCLENGSYNVTLHFAEILFTNDDTYNSLGRQMFNIYIQGKLFREDFNIEDEAHGAQRPVITYFNARVEDGTLEIRFYWASKGTTRILNRGDYGPLISAISVNPILSVCVILEILGILWWKGYITSRRQPMIDLEGLELQTIAFTLKQIRTATNNFDVANKLEKVVLILCTSNSWWNIVKSVLARVDCESMRKEEHQVYQDISIVFFKCSWNYDSKEFCLIYNTENCILNFIF